MPNPYFPIHLFDMLTNTVEPHPSAPTCTLFFPRRYVHHLSAPYNQSLIYMCPQSLFKLRPAFDLVLRDILQAFQHEVIRYIRPDPPREKTISET